MESSECETADSMDAEQLATVYCTSPQQSGRGSMPATAKVDRLAADRLWKKHRRAKETTEVHAAWLQSYNIIYSAQGAAIKLVQLYQPSLRNCSTCLHKVRTYIYINIYIAKSRIGRDHYPHFTR